MAQPQAFLENHKLLISTLSPVHMGSGEDYEPTNYVLDDETLIGFDTAGLASILTKKELEDLGKLVRQPGALLHIQSFIYGLRERIAGIASHTVTTAADVAKKYHDRIGKVAQIEAGGKKFINLLEINRTAFNPHNQQPLLPGSGLKGAIRTAVLNALTSGTLNNSTKMKPTERETDILGGSFASDPMRLLKISDASWLEQAGNPDERIVFDNNLPKDKDKLGKELKSAAGGLAVMREVIPAMISRSFSGQLGLQNFGNIQSKEVPGQKLSLQDLIKNCNKFYLSLFNSELTILKELNCLDKKWLALIDNVLDNEIKELIQKDKAILLRVGRHTGAEGMTIEGHRLIKIMGKKGAAPQYLDHATTLWLAGEQEKSKTNLQPFGWLLLEIDPTADDKISQSLADKLLSFNSPVWDKEQKLRLYMKEKRVDVERIKAEQSIKAATELANQEERKLAEIERQTALAAMSEEARLIMQLRGRVETNENRGMGPGCKLATDAVLIIDKAATWSGFDKNLMAEFLPQLAVHLGIDLKKNDKWKLRLRALK